MSIERDEDVLMKVHILFPVDENPRGGGNQFLKFLRTAFENKGYYSDIRNADVILFNSYQNISNVIKTKMLYPKKLYVHRVDGPIRLYNKMDDKRDFVTNTTNKYIADATVFQSKFSRKTNFELGMEKVEHERLIYNATDRSIFFPGPARVLGEKLKIISTSWSNNINKGFDVYKYLDEHLDFNKYEFTFVGNSPCGFNNINIIEPKNSVDLSKLLRKYDVYLSASQKDPCSNSVIEAMCCGLPVICRNDGGHPELIELGGAGRLFDRADELADILKDVKKNYTRLIPRTDFLDINRAADEYIQFFEDLLHETDGNRKKLSFGGYLAIKRTLNKI